MGSPTVEPDYCSRLDSVAIEDPHKMSKAEYSLAQAIGYAVLLDVWRYSRVISTRNYSSYKPHSTDVVSCWRMLQGYLDPLWKSKWI